MSTLTSQVDRTDLDAETAFYRHVLQTLDASGIPVLVGGAYAMAIHTGVERRTKDLDVFLRPADYGRAADVLAAAGYVTDLKFPHWLGKVLHESWCVDLIFNSGNGLTRVDDAWFEHATDGEVLGVAARIVPVEEIIWSKSFIMERERYDGADVAHLLRARAAELDWPRLMDRMAGHGRVLLAHLVLFGYIYPSRRALIPRWVLTRLLDHLHEEIHAPPPPGALCRGTLLSREQYLHDVHEEGYVDGRLRPNGSMSAEQIAVWTDAIAEDGSDTGS